MPDAQDNAPAPSAYYGPTPDRAEYEDLLRPWTAVLSAFIELTRRHNLDEMLQRIEELHPTPPLECSIIGPGEATINGQPFRFRSGHLHAYGLDQASGRDTTHITIITPC
jgi:hypothetical protein